MQETLNGESPVTEDSAVNTGAIEASRADRLETLEKKFAALEERVEGIDQFIKQAQRAAAAQEKLKSPEMQAKLKEMERLKDEIIKGIGA